MSCKFTITLINNKTDEKKSIAYETTAYVGVTRWMEAVQYASELADEMGSDWCISEISTDCLS